MALTARLVVVFAVSISAASAQADCPAKRQNIICTVAGGEGTESKPEWRYVMQLQPDGSYTYEPQYRDGDLHYFGLGPEDGGQPVTWVYQGDPLKFNAPKIKNGQMAFQTPNYFLGEQACALGAGQATRLTYDCGTGKGVVRNSIPSDILDNNRFCDRETLQLSGCEFSD